MVAKTVASKAQLWGIILRGRLFLQELEAFATANFPEDDNDDDDDEQDNTDNDDESSPTTAAAAAPSSLKRPASKSSSSSLSLLAAKRRRLGGSNVASKSLQTLQVAAAAAAASTTTSQEGETEEQEEETEEQEEKVEEQETAPPPPPPEEEKVVLQYCALTGQLQCQYPNESAAAQAFARVNPAFTWPLVRRYIHRVLTREIKSLRNLYYRNPENENDENNDGGFSMPSFPIQGSQDREAFAIPTPQPEKTVEQQQQGPYKSATTNPTPRRPIVEYCADTGKRLRSWDTVKAAARDLACETNFRMETIRKRLRRVLIGDMPRYDNRYYRYQDDQSTPMPEFPIPIVTRKKMELSKPDDSPILEYDVESGEFMAEYDTVEEAAEAFLERHPERTNLKSVKTCIYGVLAKNRGNFKVGNSHYRRESDQSPLPEFLLKKAGRSRATSTGRQDDGEVTDEEEMAKALDDENPPPDDDEQQPHKRRQLCKRSYILEYDCITGAYLRTHKSIQAAAEAFVALHPERKNLKSIKVSIHQILSRRLLRLVGSYYRREDDDSPMPSFPIGSTLKTKEDPGDTLDLSAIDDIPAFRHVTQPPAEINEEERNNNTKPPYQPGAKRIIQYCATTGEEKGRYESIGSCAREHTNDGKADVQYGSYRFGISHCLSGQVPLYKGFYYRYEDGDERPMPTFPIILPKRVSVPNLPHGDAPILEYHAETGEALHKFATVDDAAKSFFERNPNRKNIKSVKTDIYQVLSKSNARLRVGESHFRRATDRSPLPEFPLGYSGPKKKQKETTMTEPPTTENEEHAIEDNAPPPPTTATEEAATDEPFPSRDNSPIVEYHAVTGQVMGTFKNVKDAAMAFWHRHPERRNLEGIRTDIFQVLSKRHARLKVGDSHYRREAETRPPPSFPIAHDTPRKKKSSDENNSNNKNSSPKATDEHNLQDSTTSNTAAASATAGSINF